MPCSATYDATLARVRVQANFAAGQSATVERSIDQINWTTVRGGLNAPLVTGSQASPVVTGFAFSPPIDDYEFVTVDGLPSGSQCPPEAVGITNYYRTTVYTLPSSMDVTGGQNTSYASTPDTAVLDIVGDIDLRVWVESDDWIRPSWQNNQVIMAKNANNPQLGWVWWMGPDGTMGFQWSTDGINPGITCISTSSVGERGNGTALALRVVLDVSDGFGGNTTTFYTAPNITGPWTALGEPCTGGGVTSIVNNTQQLRIGDATVWAGFDWNGWVGEFIKAEVRNGIGGTVVANPDFSAQPPGTTAFNDAAGRPWTVASQAKILTDPNSPLPGTASASCTTSIVPVITSTWLKSIYQPFLNRPVRVLRAWSDVTRPSRGAVHEIVGRTLPIAITDVRGSRRWTFGITCDTSDEANDLDGMFASGDPLYLQVPNNANLPVGSMHIVVEDTATKKVAWADNRTVQLPIIEVAAPGASIVGATATWQTVLDTYATWQDVINAKATWLAVLEMVASPDQVYVP